MKNFTLLTAVLLILIIANSKAQLTGITIAPLRLNNVWVYNDITRMSRINVIDTSIIIDSISYYKLWWEATGAPGLEKEYFPRLREDGFYALRMDSTYTEPNHELPYYKKDAVIGDTWTVQTYFTYSIEDTFTTNVFGEPTTVKYLKMDGGLILRHEYWTEKFGLLSVSSFHGLMSSLQGCVIDGVVYGDTSFTLVGIEDEFNSPNDFTLEQNYPNPFNPTTTIKFSIPELRFITLVVYDLLGNEIKTLVHEEKPVGEYQVTFDGSNLASGIYVYQLKTEGKINSKKMILLK